MKTTLAFLAVTTALSSAGVLYAVASTPRDGADAAQSAQGRGQALAPAGDPLRLADRGKRKRHHDDDDDDDDDDDNDRRDRRGRDAVAPAPAGAVAPPVVRID